MDTEVRIAWIIAVILLAIGGGLLVSYIPKIGIKKALRFMIVSAGLAIFMWAGVRQMFIHINPDQQLGGLISGVFGSFIFMGTMHLQMDREDDKKA